MTDTPDLPAEINLLAPLPGLGTGTRFALLPWDEDRILFTLQSVDEPALELVVAQPWVFFPDYEPVIDEEWAGMLGVEEPGDVGVFVVLTLGDTPVETTANLAAPVVVHRVTGTASQIVLSDSRLSLRAPLGSSDAGGTAAEETSGTAAATPADAGHGPGAGADTTVAAAPARRARKAEPADVTVILTASASDLSPTRLGSALVAIGDQSVQPTAVVFISDTDDAAAIETRRAVIMAARTEWVAFVHSDDVLFPGHLQTMLLTVSAANHEVDVVYSWPVMIGEDGNPLARQPRRDGREAFDRDLLRSRTDLVVTSLVRREVAVRILEAAGTDAMDDRSFYSALVEADARFRCVPRETFLRQSRATPTEPAPTADDSAGPSPILVAAGPAAPPPPRRPGARPTADRTRHADRPSKVVPW